jgi:hypothetical protein
MSSAVISHRRIQIENDEITWAGECPWTGSYGIGTARGRVVCYKEVGGVLTPEFDETLADDAINGIAYWSDFIGISTRSEVFVHRRIPNRPIERLVAGPGGAHGILATPTGQFLAPMGIKGLFCVDVSKSANFRAWTEGVDGVPINLYGLTRLGNAAGTEVLACAGRIDGLMRIQFDPGAQSSDVSRLTASGIDFVDVCSLRSDACPYALAALCLDRSVVLVRDFHKDQEPQTLHPDQIRGTPYSIRCALGHLFILTSQHVTMLPNLAQWFLGEIVAPAQGFLQRSVQADEIFTAYDHELLVLTDDGLEIDDISQLATVRVPSNRKAADSDGFDWINEEAAPRFGAAAFQWQAIRV